MGIFSFLSGGGNFGFIARNIAAIYTAIGSCPPGKTLTKKQQLFATALVDLMNYFMEGSISIEEVEQELQRIDNDYLVYYPDRGVTPKAISLDSLKDYFSPYFIILYFMGRMRAACGGS